MFLTETKVVPLGFFSNLIRYLKIDLKNIQAKREGTTLVSAKIHPKSWILYGKINFCSIFMKHMQ